jgi:hypothetical protein
LSKKHTKIYVQKQDKNYITEHFEGLFGIKHKRSFPNTKKIPPFFVPILKRTFATGTASTVWRC